MSDSAKVPEHASRLWIADLLGGSDDYAIEDEPCAVEIERTDENEIAVSMKFTGDEMDAVTLYLTRDEALALAGELLTAAARPFKLPVKDAR